MASDAALAATMIEYLILIGIFLVKTSYRKCKYIVDLYRISPEGKECVEENN